jgi:hypothetical protein
MTIKVFDKFIMNVKSNGWVCAECKIVAQSSFLQLRSVIANLAEELADVKQHAPNLLVADGLSATIAHPTEEIADAEHQFNERKTLPKVPLISRMPTTAVVTSATSEHAVSVSGDRRADIKTALVTQRTLSDSSRRKKNVIIFGMPEDTLEGDHSELLRLCEEYPSLKPLVSESGCKRIGKAPAGRLIKLLVCLGSEQSA